MQWEKVSDLSADYNADDKGLSRYVSKCDCQTDYEKLATIFAATVVLLCVLAALASVARRRNAKRSTDESLLVQHDEGALRGAMDAPAVELSTFNQQINTENRIAWDASLVTDLANDIPTCCVGLFCSTCLYGRTREQAGLQDCFSACLTWWILSVVMTVLSQLTCGIAGCFVCPLYGCMLGGSRSEIQRQLGASDDPVNKRNYCFFTCCCPLVLLCALCQEARAVKARFQANGNRPLILEPSLVPIMPLTPLAPPFAKVEEKLISNIVFAAGATPHYSAALRNRQPQLQLQHVGGENPKTSGTSDGGDGDAPARNAQIFARLGNAGGSESLLPWDITLATGVCDDPGIFFCGAFCPCLLYGATRERAGLQDGKCAAFTMFLIALVSAILAETIIVSGTVMPYHSHDDQLCCGTSCGNLIRDNVIAAGSYHHRIVHHASHSRKQPH